MSNEVLAAMVAALTGFGVAYLTLRTQIRQARMQLGAVHRAEIIRRQLDALEAIWGIFAAASRSGGEGRMLQATGGGQAISVEEARAFIRLLEDTFNARSGLYLSQKARRALFGFRDYIRDELIGNSSNGLLPLSTEQLAAFHEKRRFVRLCLRAEVGSTDLRVAQEELRLYEAGQKPRP